MSLVHSFDGSSPSCTAILPRIQIPLRLLSFRFFLFTTNTSEKTPVLSSSSFAIYLSYQNSLFIDYNSKPVQLSQSIACNAWNIISLEENQISINSRMVSLDFPLNLSSCKFINFGTQGFTGLIELGPFDSLKSFKASMNDSYYLGNFEPLKSLAEIKQWRPLITPYISRIPLKSTKKSTQRQLIVCHDCFCSNYKLDIGINTTPCAYRYFHWARNDMFIYFSHHRLSIPPVAWVDTAHKNGSIVLGTFITEDSPGTEGGIGTQQNELLLESASLYAKIFVDIMCYYNFDGYLINIEAEVSDAGKLREWLALLTTLAHEARPNSKIIWYDSIITTGEVSWQSELNLKNNEFFNSCDGFFTDYHWKLGMPEKSALLAKSRKWEVYTGTDVFGRGTYGGGGYNTRIGAAASADTSFACFAQAWSWESAGFNEYSSFIKSETMLWSEVALPIIDMGGAIFNGRPVPNRYTALSGWNVYIYKRINEEDPPDYVWEKASSPDKYWTVSDDLVFTCGYMLSKRSVTVNLRDTPGPKINAVCGTVGVKGTGPDFKDYYKVELSVTDHKGEVHSKYLEGNCSQEWQAVELEFQVSGIVEFTWSESGSDVEGWAGFFGTSFRRTNVAYLSEGKSLLDEFEVKTHNQSICTWFSQGQGPKLYSKGKVIKDSVWNSLQDCDLLPDFNVIKENMFDFDNVYHGTSSLMIQQQAVTLFHTNFQMNDSNIRIIYKGEINLNLDNAALITSDLDGDWRIDNYSYSGQVDSISILNKGTSYLAGVHFYETFPSYRIVTEMLKVNWNIKSIKEESVVFDIEVQLRELPEFIRHIDVYVNDEFFYRIYSTYDLITGIKSSGEGIWVRFEAENLIGEVEDSLLLEIPYSDIENSIPY